MTAPADETEWDDAVMSTYRLQRVNIESDFLHARVFRTGARRPLSNAPYLEYGGITLDRDTLSATEQTTLLSAISETIARESAPYVLLKSRALLIDSTPQLYIDQQYVTFDLDLSPGHEQLWSQVIGGKTRNQIRKARRSNFQSAFGDSRLINDFWAVIRECWRDLGTPVHTYRLFDAVAEKFGDQLRFHVMYDKQKPVAAAMLFNLHGVLHHPFAGTLKAYRPTSINNLMYWNIICDACERGLKRFDMGRSTVDSGTYRYKKSWGATEQALFYHYFLRPGVKPPTLDTSWVQLATAAWKHFPLALTSRLGPSLIRHIL